MKKETKLTIMAGLGVLAAAYVALSPRGAKRLYEKKVFKKGVRGEEIEDYRQEALDDYAAAHKSQHCITAIDGRRMHGYLFRNPNVPQQQDEFLIVYSMGRCSNISNCLDNVSMLVDSGWSVFIYEYRGFGMSDEMEPTLQGIADDAVSAMNFVVDKLGYTYDQITPYGESLGGGSTMYLVSRLRRMRRDLEGLVLQSTFTALRDIGRDMWKVLWIYPKFMHHHPRMDNREELADLQPDELPLLILTGAHDAVIDKKHSHSLFAAAPEPKFMTVLEHSEHRHIWLTDRENYVRSLTQFREFLAGRRKNRRCSCKNASEAGNSEMNSYPLTAWWFVSCVRPPSTAE